MRLAFIKKRFSLYGGAEQYMKTMLSALKKEGHDIHIFANQWADEPDFTFHKIDLISSPSFMSVWSFSKNVSAALRRDRFDRIISFERTEYQDIFRAGDGCHKAWLDIRLAFEPSYKRLSFSLNPLHRYTLALEKRIFTETPVIVVNSKLVRDQIISYYGISEDKIEVAYNGVNLETFNPGNRAMWRSVVRTELGIKEDDRMILFVGTGFRRKGAELLIKALPQVINSSKERVVLIIIGKDNSSHASAIANKYGVEDSLQFLGTRPEIERYYAAADLFVLPTMYDPFSNACLEAMASGLPVITTRNNGVAEIIEDGREGYVIHSISDHEGLAGKITAALQNSVQMGNFARAKAERFSINVAAERFMGLIDSAIAYGNGTAKSVPHNMSISDKIYINK